jgi:hypothetical protein
MSVPPTSRPLIAIFARADKGKIEMHRALKEIARDVRSDWDLMSTQGGVVDRRNRTI